MGTGRAGLWDVMPNYERSQAGFLEKQTRTHMSQVLGEDKRKIQRYGIAQAGLKASLASRVSHTGASLELSEQSGSRGRGAR